MRALRAKSYPDLAIGRWLAALLAAVMIAVPMLSAPAARAAATNPAEGFVQENLDRAFAILNDTALSTEQRYMQFRAHILSLMDARRIGMFTLGAYARNTSNEDLEAFIAAFSDYTVGFIYGAGFAQTRGQTPKVTGSVQRAADDVIVNCEVAGLNSQNAQSIYKVAFRVRRAADGRSIVTDLQVEGVWLALLQRSDFGSFLSQHGGRVPELTADLRRLTRGPQS